MFVAETVSIPQFRYWVQFLNEYSNVQYAVLTLDILNIDQLRELYTNAIDTSTPEVLSFTFSIADREITVTEHDLNRILNFPTENHVPFPDVFDLLGFFMGIRYHSTLNIGDLYKHHLPREWNFFFHTLIHVFANKRGGLHGIPHFIQVIGFVVAHNLSINFGKAIMEQILIRMGSLDSRNLDNNDVQCYYPRFLQLVLDDVLTEEEKAYFSDSETFETPYLRTNVITALHNRDPHPEVPTIVTDFMQDCFLLMA